MSKDEKNVVSMYDKVVDNSGEYVAPAQQPAAKQPEAAQEQQVAADQEPSAPAQEAKKEAVASDKQATPEYIKGIQTQLDALNQQLAQGSQQPGGQPDQNAAIDQQLAALQEQATNGEITYAEMISQTAPLLEQRISAKVMDNMKQESEAQQIRGAQDAFLRENPDFMEFAQSPEAQAIRQANPIMDNVSAYYAFKAKQAEVAASELQQQMAGLKQQMETSIKGAAKEQGPISGTGAGDDMSVPKLYRGDGKTPFDGGIAALRRARANQ